METLKIVLTSMNYPPHHFGGDAMHVYYLANELAKAGHEVDVIYNRGLYELRSNKKIKKISYPNYESVRLHALTVPFERVSRVSLYALGSYYFLNKQISTIMKSVKPDVLHHHSIVGLGVPILNLYAPCVLHTAHDYGLICPMSSLMYAGKTFCNGNSNCFICTLKSKRPVQIWRYYRPLKKKIGNMDMIITPSNFMKDTLLNYNIPIQMETIYNFVPQPPEITEQVYDSPYFLFVGVLSPVKGIENLISAYLQICDQIEAHLLIVGDGPLKTKLREQITNSGKQDRIKLLGKVEYETLISLYKNALAIAIPSIWPENCPLVALESLSCETPIIAANTGGLPEIVNISKAGMLFEKDNVDDLSSCLLEFWSENMKKYLQQNANSAYKNLFSPKSYLENYQNLINKCMER